MSYKYLEHIGDAAIEATAATLEEAFAEAGRAMFGIMIERGTTLPETTVEIRIKGREGRLGLDRKVRFGSLKQFIVDRFQFLVR
ncbi:MAG: archease [bacterium]